MIEARSISFKAGKKTLLDQVDFTLSPGEMVGVIGRNGAGKSTFLNVLTGENDKFSGTVTIDGKALNSFSLLELAKKRAVLSQSISTQFNFSVLDILLQGRYPYIPLKSSDYELVDFLIEEFKLEPLLSTPYNLLSGGEKQRIHLAKCLAQIMPFEAGKPKYLFLDEPLSALDLSFQRMVLAYLKNLVARHELGVFVILHDLNWAAKYCNRICLLNEGKAAETGAPMEVFTAATLEKYFQVNATIIQSELSKTPAIIFN